MPRLPYIVEVYYHTHIPRHMENAIDYYVKRISGICRFSDEKVSGKIDTKGAYILDGRGKEMTTMEFISFIKSHNPGDRLRFIVGPPEGFTDEDRRKAANVISLSKLTLQHDIAHIVLLEQIYRALLTIAGVDYNK